MKPALAALGGAILLCTVAAVALHVPGSIWVGTLARKDAVVGLIGASTAAYFAAVAMVLRAPPPSVLPVLAVALLLRLVLLAAPPMMSSDIYRYVWDGRVQNAGINPYRDIPAAPALANLRDATIYPRINRADYARTIYPPAAQLIFRAVTAVSQSVTAMKAAMLLLEAAGIAAMLRLLGQARLPRARILIYAWNPLAAWAIASEGHIDAAAIGLVGLALLAAVWRRSALAGGLLGAAILTKFLPLAVAPALWRRWDWRFPAALAATIVALYALYAGAGAAVLGFLPGYTQEEGLAGGSGFWLLAAIGHLAPLPAWTGRAYAMAAAVLLAALAAAIAFGEHDPDAEPRDPVRVARGVAILAACTTAALSPHYPWYYVWLALPCCLAPLPSVIFLSAAPFLLYSDPYHDAILIPSAVFIPAALLALRDLAQRAPHALAPARSI